MTPFPEKFARFVQKAVFALFALLALAVLALFILGRLERSYVYLFSLAGAAACLIAAALFCRFREKIAPLFARRWVFWALLILCLAVKLGWVLLAPTVVPADAQTFHYLAAELSASWQIDQGSYLPHYVAVFPHIFGYSSFLSVFYALFGADTQVAALANVALSLGTGACIFCLCRQLTGSRACAAVGLLLWTVFPSQTIYNMYAFSEPWYTFLLFLSACVFCALGRDFAQRPLWKSLLLAGAGGAILVLVNAARPIAAIVLIMLFVWLFLCNRLDAGARALLRRTAVLAAVLAVYLLGGALNSALLEARIGEAPASSVGYSLAVGFNAESGGAWNSADGETLSALMEASEPFDAQAVQEAMGDLARERITSGGINWPKFLAGKLNILWSSDAACVTTYGGTDFPHAMTGQILCEAFHLALWALGLWAALLGLRGRLAGLWCLPGLFILGLTCAQLLVEVAGRYHYAGAAALVPLAAAALFPHRKPTPASGENCTLPSI